MIVNLSDTERVITDNLQFITQSKSIIKTGENKGNEVWTNTGNHPGINFALRHIAKNIVLENDDFKVMVEKLNQLDIKIDEVRELLENMRVKDLLTVNKFEAVEELVEEEYEGEI